MKKLIKYFTPVGEEQIAFAKALMVVVTAIISILFLFTFLELIS
jgi:competence protein ComGC